MSQFPYSYLAGTCIRWNCAVTTHLEEKNVLSNAYLEDSTLGACFVYLMVSSQN